MTDPKHEALELNGTVPNPQIRRHSLTNKIIDTCAVWILHPFDFMSKIDGLLSMSLRLPMLRRISEFICQICLFFSFWVGFLTWSEVHQLRMTIFPRMIDLFLRFLDFMGLWKGLSRVYTFTALCGMIWT